MRMKRLLFVLMAIIMVFTFGVLGCTPAISGGGNDNPPAPPGPVTPPGGGDEDPENPIVKVPWIKISNTELTLDQYDEYQLTTTTGNTEKAVVWSSNNSTVVSVDQTGYIIAKNPGNAIITAKAGTDASDPIATCQVRVLNNPGAMATLEIYPDVISVGKNGQYTLAVKPMFNGKEITDSATLDAIEYDWKLSGSETALANDFVSAQVSATNKNEITFTGLDYGSATYYVSALIRGANVMETVVVTCNNADYNFKIEGGDIKSGSGAFVATVAGIGATLTPVVKAYTKEGTEVGAVAATWVSDNAEVATVSGEVITATGFGTVTLVGTFADNAYKGVAVAIKLTVTRPEGQLTEAFTFETGKTTFRAPSGLGEITDIFYGGVSYFVSA
ncbi:MAG: Ig-like domain-containing protein, partial [Clostridia bacterium]|nr:Ig-like domain-containing protein [Clostridia bacterium]